MDYGPVIPAYAGIHLKHLDSHVRGNDKYRVHGQWSIVYSLKMTDSIQRIFAMFIRYTCLHKRSVSRVLEFIFWPVMELMVWGFVAMYIRSLAPDDLSRTILFLISAIIFWDLLYRSQQGVTLSLIEDIWTQNILNLLISPLKIWEWLVATCLYGLVKTILITGILAILAFIFYQFDLVSSVGFYLIPLVANLLLFGWALGVFTSGLLIRWAHAVEALIWGIPFLVQPLSAIYYPLSILPPWLQTIAKMLPSTYVFEGMRAVMKTGEMPTSYFFMSLGLNFVYFVLASLFFMWMYHKSRATGRLGRLGID